MPDAAVLDAPPSQTQNHTGESSAISSFADEIVQLSKPVETATPETPTDTPKEETGEVVDETPKDTAKPAESTTPKEKPMSEWTLTEFDAAMKKAPSKAYKIYEAYKKKTEGQLSEAQTLREKVKALEAKPVESPGDSKKIEAYENQIKELNEQNKNYLKTISESDYSKSPEFKKQYLDRYANARKTAIDEIKQLDVAEGESTRQATDTDFDMLMALPLREQRARAKAMFGDTADVFFSHRNTLYSIKQAGMEAIREAADGAEQRTVQKEMQSKEEQRAYSDTLAFEKQSLAEKIPGLFGKTENKEASEQFDKGIAFAEKILSERNSMSPADRAVHDAVLQMTHAGYRRAVVEMKEMKSQISALKTELENLRGSDPGKATTGKAVNGKHDDDNLGIDDMALAIAPKTR